MMSEWVELGATVSRVDQLSPLHFQVAMRAPAIARAAQPGQFVQVRVNPIAASDPGRAVPESRAKGDMGAPLQWDPLLRRPFSLYGVDEHTGEILLLGQRVGRGSQLLGLAQPGQVFSVIGPLGRPFWRRPEWRHLLLIGGGVGVAPLIFAGQRWAGQGVAVDALFGYRSAAVCVGWEKTASWAQRRWLTTEDGSAGRRGFVTAWLADLGESESDSPGPADGASANRTGHAASPADSGGAVRADDFDAVYACGPEPLLARVAAWARRHHLPCQLSLERAMGCGLGVCLSCVCFRQDGSPALTCTDGPVFDAAEVRLGYGG